MPLSEANVSSASLRPGWEFKNPCLFERFTFTIRNCRRGNLCVKNIDHRTFAISKVYYLWSILILWQSFILIVLDPRFATWNSSWTKRNADIQRPWKSCVRRSATLRRWWFRWRRTRRISLCYRRHLIRLVRKFASTRDNCRNRRACLSRVSPESVDSKESLKLRRIVPIPRRAVCP